MTERYAGFRVGIVGSCQVGGLAQGVRRLLPGAHVEAWHFNVTPGSAEDIADYLAQCDLAVSQITPDIDAPPLQEAVLRPRCKQLVVMPILSFPGLFPDLTYLFHEGRPLTSPMGEYHSAIVYSSFELGLSAGQTHQLFNTYVYLGLGYFKSYEDSRQALINMFASYGFDLSSSLNRWFRFSDYFMYTFNHPKINVILELAEMIVEKAGLHYQADFDASDEFDFLSHGPIWPVYPELAKRFGIAVPDTLQFVISGSSDYRSTERSMSLRQFIDESYSIYRNVDTKSLQTWIPETRSRIEGMLSNWG